MYDFTQESDCGRKDVTRHNHRVVEDDLERLDEVCVAVQSCLVGIGALRSRVGDEGRQEREELLDDDAVGDGDWSVATIATIARTAAATAAITVAATTITAATITITATITATTTAASVATTISTSGATKHIKQLELRQKSRYRHLRSTLFLECIQRRSMIHDCNFKDLEGDDFNVLFDGWSAG